MVKNYYRGYFKLNNIIKTDSQITLKISMLKIIGGYIFVCAENSQIRTEQSNLWCALAFGAKMMLVYC